MQLGFGSGALWGIKAGSNQTPARFGILQNCGVDFKANSKALYGTNQFPVAVARGAVSVTGKANLAQFTARFFNDIFFGSTSAATAATTIVVDNEAGTIPGTPYAITVSNSATWVTDLGVIYKATGLPLTRVASGPAAGQYSVSAGVYTFAAADTTLLVKISYTYTASSGATLTISNAAMGVAPTYKTVLSSPYNSQDMVITLNACVADGLSINTALEDFAKQDFSFSAFTDSSDVLGTICFSEVI